LPVGQKASISYKDSTSFSIFFMLFGLRFIEDLILSFEVFYKVGDSLAFI
jgi:hypothetical protein